MAWNSRHWTWDGATLFIPDVPGSWVEMFRGEHRGPDLAEPDACGEQVPHSQLVPGSGKRRGLV